MQSGLVVDRGHCDFARQAKWVEGQPETSFWVGIILKGKHVRRVTAQRCVSRGLLEFYAIEKAPK